MPDIPQNVVDIGVGGTFALLVLKIVLDFITTRKAKESEGIQPKHLEPIMTTLQTLFDMHNVTDNEGVRIWYGRTLAKDIAKLEQTIDKQLQVQQMMVIKLSEIATLLRKNGQP